MGYNWSFITKSGIFEITKKETKESIELVVQSS